MVFDEKLIKEKRTVLATTRKLMGLEGKFGVVMMNLGDKIIGQYEGGKFFDAVYLEDYYDTVQSGKTPEEDAWLKMPIIDDGRNGPSELEEEYNREREYVNTTDEGWYFDGLHLGVHLEIKYLIKENTLTAKYKGYLVYKEVSGELEAYVPLQEWEDELNKLYIIAKKCKEQKTEQVEKLIDIAGEKKKQSLLKRMIEKWGI